ncbi:Protein of unknown function [Alteromonadaceae bacterium Bs31]|nr:Protein of unknown function [Alteromonadaceae bacterium Bs31]
MSEMSKYLRRLGCLSMVCALLIACSEKKMSEAWCEDMMVKANAQWTEEETRLFARDCLEP